MLQSLHIENIAVIKDAEIEFAPGFTALTGETGAGKSMIIDGLNLLRGSRASRDLIRTGAERASVTAMFVSLGKTALERLRELDVHPDEDGCLFLSRYVYPDGPDGVRSQMKIGGFNVPASLGREVGRLLIDIHGQNDNLILSDSSSHLSFLDEYAGNADISEEYSGVYGRMVSVASKIKELRARETQREYELEKAKRENAEISAAKPRPGEEEELEKRAAVLKSGELVKKSSSLVYKALLSNEKGVTASYLIERAVSALESLEGVIPDAPEMAKKLSGIGYEIEDIAERAKEWCGDPDADPEQELEAVGDRLQLLSNLRKKYGVTLADVIEHAKKNSELIGELENSENLKNDLLGEYAREREKAVEIAKKISRSRNEAAVRLREEVLGVLSYLDMKNVDFSVSLKETLHPDGQLRLAKTGCDDAEFLISTNPGEPLMPLSKTASGGELARIMLALKSVLSGKAGTDTSVYDEIDSGISGSTSQKIGFKLREISAAGSQIICVTHSAQIASAADMHCLIKKTESDGRAHTTVTVLDDESRALELARIIGGVDITEKTVSAAKELLRQGRAAGN